MLVDTYAPDDDDDDDDDDDGDTLGVIGYILHIQSRELRWTAASRFPSVRTENNLPGDMECHLLKKLSWVFLSYMHPGERVLVKKEENTA